MLPDEVARRRVDGLDDVAGVGHVEHAPVGEGRALLAARVQGAGPHEAQVGHVAAVDLVEGAVAPAVERAPPHQPVFRRRILQHGVGHRREVGRRRLRRGGSGLDGQPEQEQGCGRGRPRRRGPSESDTCGSSHRGRVRHVVVAGKTTAYARAIATATPLAGPGRKTTAPARAVAARARPGGAPRRSTPWAGKRNIHTRITSRLPGTRSSAGASAAWRRGSRAIALVARSCRPPGEPATTICRIILKSGTAVRQTRRFGRAGSGRR